MSKTNKPDHDEASDRKHERPAGAQALSNEDESPMASVGSASGLQPSGTVPGRSPATGQGSIGTGGGSTGGAATGGVAQVGKRSK